MTDHAITSPITIAKLDHSLHDTSSFNADILRQ